MADESTPVVHNDPAAAFQKLLEKKNGDGLALASQMFDENYQLRVKNRELADRLPKDGTVSLSADDAKRYEAFKALELEPDAIKASLAKIPELEKTAKELAGMETLRELAEIGIDGAKLKLPVLKDRLEKFPDAVISFKTEKDKDGKEVKVASIRNGDKELPFTQFARDNFADYLPALKAEADNKQITNGNTADPAPRAMTSTDKLEQEMRAQAATGRYSL